MAGSSPHRADLGVERPLGGRSTVLVNRAVGLEGLRSLGRLYTGLLVRMEETVRKLPDEAILLLTALVSLIRWRSLPDSNRCTSLERRAVSSIAV